MYTEFYLAMQDTKNEAFGIEGQVYFKKVVFNMNDVEYFFGDEIEIDGELRPATQISILGTILVLMVDYATFKNIHRECKSGFYWDQSEVT